MESLQAVDLSKNSKNNFVVSVPQKNETLETVNVNKKSVSSFEIDRLSKNPVVEFDDINESTLGKGFKKVDAENVENVEKEAKRNVKTANAVMDVLDKKLRFVPDERVDSNLIVQLVDEETGKVLKQFPPEEMITLMAKIEDSVLGMLVDNSA